MSRLTEQDIDHLSENLAVLDEKSLSLTGGTIEELAREAAGFVGDSAGITAAVVPITAGLGLIGNFSESCRAILSHCGANAFITKGTDVTGIQEAYRAHAQLIFTADDDTCTMLSTATCSFSDNGDATGRAFAVALKHLMRYRKKEKVLVIGAGPVGTAALHRLRDQGLDVAVFDIDREKGRRAAEKAHVTLEEDPTCFRRYHAILDATCTGNFIHANDVDENTLISAPGMPLCTDAHASKIVTLYHNPLELGVATMYFECLKSMNKNEG